MPNILQVSNDVLGRNPIRLSKLINKYSKNYKSRCITWNIPKFDDPNSYDLIGSKMSPAEIADRVEWADIIHLHGTAKQELYDKFPDLLSKSQPLVQLYDSVIDHEKVKVWVMRDGEKVTYSIPVAVTPRWNTEGTADYLVLDPIDVYDDEFKITNTKRKKVIVKLLKSDNTHPFVRVVLRQQRAGVITCLPDTEYPPVVELEFKKGVNICVDATELGTYSSSLDFLASGIPTFCTLKYHVKENIALLTTATLMPWVIASRDTFLPHLLTLTNQPSRAVLKGKEARQWMQKYWSPENVLKHYESMYSDLL